MTARKRYSFVNAICRQPMPDAYGHGYKGERAPWELRCKRRNATKHTHRVKFDDGRYRSWEDGDFESVLESTEQQ